MHMQAHAHACALTHSAHTYNGLALAYINNEDGLENQWWSSEFSAAHFHFSSREIKVSAFLL